MITNSPHQRSRRQNLFYVEDIAIMQEVVRHYLSNNFSVRTSNNCSEALNILQNGNIPDIILTDLHTPELDGFDFLLQLRSNDFLRAIPVIVLSGDNRSEVRIKCLEAGADDYIAKPFNPLELQARINNVLTRAWR